MRILLIVLALCLGTSVRAQSDEPTPNEFVDIQKEPEEIQPLEKMVQYPEVARRSGLEGAVTLEALIDKQGNVIKVHVLSSDYDVFKEPAIDAMMKEKYTPAISEGKPIKVWITRKINFKLLGDDNTATSSNPFVKFLGLSLDSVREIFQKIGGVTETKTDNGLHLHASSSSGYSDGKKPASFDGWMAQMVLRS